MYWPPKNTASLSVVSVTKLSPITAGGWAPADAVTFAQTWLWYVHVVLFCPENITIFWEVGSYPTTWKGAEGGDAPTMVVRLVHVPLAYVQVSRSKPPVVLCPPQSRTYPSEASQAIYVTRPEGGPARMGVRLVQE